MPVRVWQQAPLPSFIFQNEFLMSKSSYKKSSIVYQQDNLFGEKSPKSVTSVASSQVKKPFIPPQYQALDAGELRQNFVYMLRVLMNSANRQPNDLISQKRFAQALIAELKIKKGMGSIEIETRNAILVDKK